MQKLEKLILKKKNRLNYILNKDRILQKTSKYNKYNKLKVRERQKEWDARTWACKMTGLCHVCYSTNEEIYNHKGQILCQECLEKQTHYS